MTLSYIVYLKEDETDGGVRETFISRKRWEALEKKVADLERQVQSQPLEIISALHGKRNEMMKKASLPHNPWKK